MKQLLAFLLLLAISPGIVTATELGINYYHETMMGWWGDQYIPRDLEHVNTDLETIKQATNYVKFYANPLVEGNTDWVLQVTEIAREKNMHVVVVMNTEDRWIDNSVWNNYADKVVEACKQFEGYSDEFIVANELALHSDFDINTIRNKVEALMQDCKVHYSAPVSYEAFWYAKAAWNGYQDKIYLNLYENRQTFSNNANEMRYRWGSNAIVGEFGDDYWNEQNYGGSQFQIEEVKERYKIMQKLDVPAAYLFTFREPSGDGFGIYDENDLSSWNQILKLTNNTNHTRPVSKPNQEAPPSTWKKASYKCNPDCEPIRDEVEKSCRNIDVQMNSGVLKTRMCQEGERMHWYAYQRPQEEFQMCIEEICLTQTQGSTYFLPKANNEWSCEGSECEITYTKTGKRCFEAHADTTAGQIKARVCPLIGLMYAYSQPDTDWKICHREICVNSENGARVVPLLSLRQY